MPYTTQQRINIKFIINKSTKLRLREETATTFKNVIMCQVSVCDLVQKVEGGGMLNNELSVCYQCRDGSSNNVIQIIDSVCNEGHLEMMNKF